jgi:integrase
MNTELSLKSMPGPIEYIQRSRNLSASTKSRYIKVLTDYLSTGGNPADADQLAEYAAGLSDSGRSFLSAAVNRWSDGTIRYVKSVVTPETAQVVQAIVYRLEAVRGAIETKQKKGETVHRWLSRVQVRELFSHCPAGIVGYRDRAALGLLVGAGLRRDEAVNLEFANIKVAPIKDRQRTILNIDGKGDKKRSIPISQSLSCALMRWGSWLDYEGYVLRSLGNNQEPAESLSAVALFNLVRKYGELIGVSDLASHDMRRTYAQLGFEAGVPITQISKLLGHSSIKTTQRYLNLELDLEQTVSDFIPID